MTKAVSTLVLVVFILISIAVPGVYALWQYSLGDPAPMTDKLATHVNKFQEYKGVYIKDVEVISASGVKVVDYGFNLPTTHTAIINPSSSSATITYKVTLHNNTDSNYWYVGREHPASEGQNGLIDANNGITIILKDHQSDSSNTFNTQDRIPPQTEREIYVTYRYGSMAQSECTTSVELLFGIRMDAVHDEFLRVLNDNSVVGYNYKYLTEVFNSAYAEDGSLTITTESHPEVFENLFTDLLVDFDGVEKQANIVIRRENLDKDGTSGDAYAGGPSGCEYTLYITVDSIIPGRSATVYAISYSKGAPGMGSDWYQIGELYEGKAPINADGSIDYEAWRAVYKEYEIADGIVYKVAAPNGDQYDIMTTMEQLISAVDQDIFNQIDNTNIFKKVYDILKKYPGSQDPAVLGLRRAFDDAAIFYRNLNNGQEFKVVRDKYTRAEIIYALKNIQAALDYYYQTDH